MKKFIIAGLAFAPSLVFAQDLGGLDNLLDSISGLVSSALPIVVAIGVLAFFWGLVKFIFAGEEGKKEGQHLMIWGLVALFVMVSIWGLIEFIGDSLDIDQGGTVVVPDVQDVN